jgi:hypothetical protein
VIRANVLPGRSDRKRKTPWGDTFAGQKCWLEKVMFRAKNKFGGYVEAIAEVYVVNNNGSENALNVTLE